MSKPRSSYELLRQVGTLFDAGVVTGLSDAQLLERFTAQSVMACDTSCAAEAAFAALVSRHGPMVLGVCRRALADPGEVEDAFQATFLVLVRRASSVRVDDSLGRWLYGVSRRVAAKARARSERSRARSLPLASEPVAGNAPDDEAETLAALDEEMSRLPEKYRAPVVLCHLEGLSHAEAATRLRWPVGTVSGRLSRARGLLKQRLVRRGLAPTDGVLTLLVASERVRVAVPEPLATATARAAVRLSLGGVSQAGAASASVLSLMNEVLRAAVVVKLKTVAAVLLALVFAGTTLAAVGRGLGDGEGERERSTANVRNLNRKPADTRRTDAARPADELVAEIDSLLKTVRRGLPPAEWNQAHGKIVSLVHELRTTHPADPRGARYLPKRWQSLWLMQRREQASAEVHTILKTTRDPLLKKDALYHDTWFKSMGPLDGLAAASMAEAYSRQSAGDNRAGELLYNAAKKLDDDWMTRVVLVVAFATAGGLTAIKRRGWKLVFRLGVAVLVIAMILLCGIKLLAPDRLTTGIDSLYKWLNDPTTLEKERLIASWYASQILENLRITGSNLRTGLAVALAGVMALSVVVARSRVAEPPRRWPATVRLGILALLGTLALSSAVDAGLIAYRRNELLGHLVQDFPDSFRGRLAQGERRQRDRIGEPFELEFTDVITGRRVTMKELRGKVVVVDFWATWCGPCVSEIPELIRLYRQYHDRGVEFIGVSLDLAEEDGGLEELKTFVAKEQIPWPQYYQGKSWAGDFVAGTPMNTVSESWGIKTIPTVFLIDDEGKLNSTEARGRLATLIPRLLKRRELSAGDR